jgi:hypothetical protein
MGGDDVGKAEYVLDGFLEAVIAVAASVGLVAAHDACPLGCTHGAGAAVGQQIDENVAGGEQEYIIRGVDDQPFPLRARGHANGLDRLDAKGLDDCAHGLTGDVATPRS